MASSNVAIIRTSDRNAFKQCRRKWAWSSHLRGNMEPNQQASPLWFGIGFHFAMEDYHGYRRFADPRDALTAFVAATKATNAKALPDNYMELYEMGLTMLGYYLRWEKHRADSLLPTYWHEGKPQVEVNFRIDLPIDQDFLNGNGYDSAQYSGSIDRVVYDEEFDQLWLLDYKTAAMFNTGHLMIDPQITAYCWAASEMYDKPVAGMIYAQHLKANIGEPKVLKNGTLSTAQNQRVSVITYGDKLVELYGSLEEAPEANLKYLEGLRKMESDRNDKFIQYTYVPRSQDMLFAEGEKILMECEDMLNRNLPLYPNPSYQCSTFCSFLSPCTSLDNNLDWEHEMEENFRKRPESYDPWREKLIWPE